MRVFDLGEASFGGGVAESSNCENYAEFFKLTNLNNKPQLTA
jgi:hypothetical protein